MVVTSASPVTGVGDRLWLAVPLPSWPEVFRPEHDTVRSSLIAHEWLPPTANAEIGGAGGQFERHRNVAICARVTGFDGEYLPGPVPEVMCCSISQVTAVS